jgi:hypothetical protein
MRSVAKILRLVSIVFRLDCFKEGFVDFVAFRTLLKMMAYVRKRLIGVFPCNLKIDESWKDVKEFRTEHFLIFDSKNGSD